MRWIDTRRTLATSGRAFEARRPLKLLTVCATLDPATGGGITARTLQLTRVLSERGVQCAILTTDDRRQTPDAPSGASITSLPAAGGRFRVPWRGFARLRDAVQSADLVLLMNHWTMLNALAYRAARRFGKPHVVCPAGALPLFGRSGTIKTLYNAAIGRRIVRGAAAHIAISRDEIQHLADYGVGPDRIALIPNAVPPPARAGQPAAFRQRHGLGDAPVLLFLGRLAPIKGPDLLLTAFQNRASELNGWHLVLAGPDDGMLESLRQAVARSGIADRVHFAGFLDAGRKQDALAAADLVVVPSRSEAMSIVVLEAAAAGRAVLVTDRCGVPEVAEVGGGWVVPASVAGLEGGLMAAAAERAALPGRGESWRKFAVAEYSWPHIARLHLDVFERVLAQGNRS
jgi:glycosyltransferase involved in cell wall biosynthesis